MGKVIAVCIVVLIIDLVVIAMCKAAKEGDRELERPDLIKMRGKKY